MTQQRQYSWLLASTVLAGLLSFNPAPAPAQWQTGQPSAPSLPLGVAPPGANYAPGLMNPVTSPYPGQNGLGYIPSATLGGISNPYPYPVNPMFNCPYGVPGYINAPVPIGGGNFSFRLGNMNCNLWKAPSGYYYPYSHGFGGLGLGYVNTIFIAPNSQEPPVAKQPPVSVQFTDTFKFLDDARKDQKLSDNDYESLKRRATDIQKKERSYRIAQGGVLDTDVENEIRRDLDNLANEIASRVKN